MWRVAGLNGLSLSRLLTLRAVSNAAEEGPTRLPRVKLLLERTARHPRSLATNLLLTTPERSLAGRSPYSRTPPPHYSNTTTFSSQRSATNNISTAATDTTSSFDDTEEQSLSSVAQASRENANSSSFESHALSRESRACSTEATSGVTSGEDAKSTSYRGASRGGLRSQCTYDESKRNTDYGSSKTTQQSYNSQSQPSASDESYSSAEHSNRRNDATSSRRSRRDDYEDARRVTYSSLQPLNNTPNRATSINVSHRGNSSLAQKDREFVALRRNRAAQQEWNKRFPEGTIVVYTDGSCIDNRASGFGIYFGPDHELNRSERIIGPVHNSSLAEILAAQKALTSLRNWRGYNNERVILRTDFLPLVRAMSEGTSDGRFASEMEKVRSLAMEYPNGVQFQHVYAHDGDPGNEQADTLARIATADARRARSASAPHSRNWYGSNWEQRGRPRSQARTGSRGRSRSRSRDRAWVRNRSRSRNNDRAHIRSHSAFVPGRRR